MPLQATSGAASYDAFGGGVAAVPNYIEECFSAFLYTGNGSTQTITNGIDLSTKGGLVWIKDRSNGGSPYEHALTDTARGATNEIQSNSTAAQTSDAARLTSFNSNGFSVGSSARYNSNTASIASWTFRKQPKFFDVVTYTGNGSTQNIAHNLGSVPGCIIVKEASAAGNDWQVYHRSTTNTCGRLFLNLTNAENANGRANTWGDNTNPVPPTSTVFTVGNTGSVNNNGATFVAYLFAHDAGGFGLTGTDNVISCGSFTGSATSAEITLGYEPQWILYKESNNVAQWNIVDNMRGLPATPASGNYARGLYPNTSGVEDNRDDIAPTATGFKTLSNSASNTYIYIAIRRGPMKVPTSGTSVFAPVAASSGTQTTGFPVDMQILSYRSGTDAFLNHQVIDRLRGVSSTSTPQGNYLNTSSTAAESNVDPYTSINMSNTGFDVGNNYAGASGVFHSFGRAPSFFDEVCYTGTGSATTFSHNLGVAPEMMIVKGRTNTFSWFVYQKDLTSANESFLTLNTDSSATSGSAVWNSTSPTSSVFSVGSANAINQSGETYVAYLFATCAGVSKVFSFTGNGSSQTINCGFTAGARWVLIKRTDSTGDWYVWDSARGIVSGNDPHLSLNTTAAEVTTDDTIDTDSTGFVVNQVSATNVNVSSATYIGIAIA